MRPPKSEKEKSSKRKRVVLAVFTVVVLLAILAIAAYFSESPVSSGRLGSRGVGGTGGPLVTFAAPSPLSQAADRQQVFLLQALGEVHPPRAGLRREGRLRGGRGRGHVPVELDGQHDLSR